MKKLLMILSFTGVVSAQSLTPEVIATSGTSFSNASAKLDFTIGEVATSTLTAGGHTLTQGFHQPEIHFASLENHTDDFAFKLYPNPTEQFVTVASTKKEDMRVHIYDINGKAIQTSSIFQDQVTLDLQSLAAGSYILRITTDSGQPLHSYTVIKKSIN